MPELKTITETVYASGILVPENEIVLRAQTEGTIRELYVKEGDSVASCKVLMEILNNRMGSATWKPRPSYMPPRCKQQAPPH